MIQVKAPNRLRAVEPPFPGTALPAPQEPERPDEPTPAEGAVPKRRAAVSRWFADLGLRGKFLLGFAAVDLLFVAFVAVFLAGQWQELRRAETRLGEQGARLAALIGSPVAPALEFGDTATVRQIVRENASLVPELVQIAVYQDGRALVREGSSTDAVPQAVLSGEAQVRRDGAVFVSRPLPLAVGEAAVVLELSTAALRARVRESVIFAGVLSLAFLLSGLVISLLLARGIVRSVQLVVATVSDVTADGRWDLTRRVPETGGDEPGRLAGWINGFLAETGTLVGSVKRAAGGVTAGGEEIAIALEQLSASAEALSESIEHVAENATRQVDRLRENAEQARQTAELAEQVRGRATGAGRSAAGVVESAREGHGVAERARGKMSRISERTAETRRAMDELHALSGRIDAVVGAIRGIAAQTNLLALNAAIEAARAGEYGRGFAVVADEVRKLAEAAARHTAEIGESVESIRDKVSGAVASVANVEAEVADGVAVIGSTAALLERVVLEVEVVAGEVREITVLAVEQGSSLEHVLAGAMELAELGELQAASATEMAATVEEQTASTAEVARSAEALNRIVRELQAETARIHV
ncbi:MAG TPA: methyl-accepting chemotaxis protein [Longimicrobiaceae bacterium]|nr:methyl-accepting chemotaxis protein [Longimicrobiaceae bacterium]